MKLINEVERIRRVRHSRTSLYLSLNLIGYCCEVTTINTPILFHKPCFRQLLDIDIHRGVKLFYMKLLLGCKAYRLCQIQNQSQKPSTTTRARTKTKSQVSLATFNLPVGVTCLAVEFYLSLGLSCREASLKMARGHFVCVD